MLCIDLSGKRAFVAGIADDAGYGFAIAKQLAVCGARVCAGTWPPAYGVFTKLLSSGRIRASLALEEGRELSFERIQPFDGAYDSLDQVPSEVLENRRYKPHGDFTIQGAVDRLVADFGDRPLDIVVHSFANSPEVRRPLIETSRAGYLAALGTSAYSLVSMVQRFGPVLRPGGSFLSLSYLASERAVPGYGGGMSSAKAALESDTRVLAYEAGRRFGARVNCISAGPLASRAASAIGFIDAMIEFARQRSPLPDAVRAEEVAMVAAFLASPLASGITGATIFVDKGFHAVSGVPDPGAPADRSGAPDPG
jgi:enoyl-[acyl-carrier protein] reductase I